MLISVDDLTGPDVRALLRAHLDDLMAVSPPESCHALDLDGLRRPDVTVWTIRDGAVLAGCAALQRLGRHHGELKCMRIVRGCRERGLASLLLQHIIAEAKRRDYDRVSLETGSMPFFEPARKLYRKHGFDYCAPFAGYREDPNSVFMTKRLAPGFG